MPDDTRTDYPADGDVSDRSTLLTMLDYTRKTSWTKCEGLSDEDARRAPPDLAADDGVGDRQPPALGRVLVDPGAARRGGRSGRGRTTEDPDREFHYRLDGPLSACSRTTGSRRAQHDELIPGLDLDQVGVTDARRPADPLALDRSHLIEENARHNGHLDILRELVDGSTGD